MNGEKLLMSDSMIPTVSEMAGAIDCYTTVLGGRYPKGSFRAVGSGVKIRICDKFFIATAAHVLDFSQKGASGISTEIGCWEEELGKIKNKGKHINSDVGFLEVEGGNNFLDLSRLADFQVDGVQYDLVGYPEIDTEHTKSVARLPNGTQLPITPGGLVVISKGDCVVEGITAAICKVGIELVELRNGGYVYAVYNGPHAVFAYPEKNDAQWRSFGNDSSFVGGESVVGFSGGGVWRIMLEPVNKVWNPLNCIKLYGIQSCWSEGGRYLIAVPIAEWLTMIKYEYKGLLQ
jgi:hypothetical protein